ncbi:hypothetical protein KFK09_007502 [Dendrobium nobile]|uniref:Uncharacterized protein n=1 Tax=Dendrobium nobile TaxID=94219 RepID=A0A8T3BWQ3_DENNO|nr:hypothetical protein KFK09_007502 [Dendrobium nobile]
MSFSFSGFSSLLQAREMKEKKEDQELSIFHFFKYGRENLKIISGTQPFSNLFMQLSPEDFDFEEIEHLLHLFNITFFCILIKFAHLVMKMNVNLASNKL